MENNELTLGLIFRAVLKYKKRGITIIVVFLLITTGLFFVLPHKYSSHASIFPPEQNSAGGGLSSFLSSFSGGGGALFSMAGTGSGTQSKVYADILNSRSTAKHVIEVNKLDSNKYFKDMKPQQRIKLIRKSMPATVRKTGFIDIDVNLATGFFPTDKDKDEVAELTRQLVISAIDGLDSILKEKNRMAAEQSKLYIEKEIHKYSVRLDSIEDKLQEYQSSNNVLEIEEQMKMILTQAIETGAELGKAKFQLNVARRQYQPNTPQLQALEEKYRSIEEQYNNIQSGGLTQQDAMSISLEKVPELSREYASLFRDKKIIEEVMLFLETQKHQEAIKISKDIPQISVLDAPEVPFQKSAPSYRMMYIFAFLLGCLIAVFTALYKAAKDGMIKLKDDTE